MRIITIDAEKTLLRRLDHVNEHRSGWRCLHINLAKSNNNVNKEILANVVSTIREDSGEVFFCDDGDILVLLPSALSSVFEVFLLHLATLLNKSSLDDYSTFYDLKNSWSVLRVLCEEKWERLQKKKQEKSLENKDKATQSPITADMINTIASRRHKRPATAIVIVEDDPFSSRLVCNSLKGKYQLSAAADGKSAIESYVRFAPDVMFLDIELPDMTGHDVLQEILKYDPEAYIIMLSGNSDKANVLRAVEQGAKGFVAKPFSKEKLLQYIEKCPTTQS